MANVIRVKRSAVPGRVPQVADLELGELAINTNDGKLYTKKNVSGVESIVDLSAGTGGGGGGGNVSIWFNTTAPVDPAEYPLWWNTEEGQLKIYYADGDSSQWVDASAGTVGPQGPAGNTLAILDELNDVDTSTTPPTIGQTLVLNDSDIFIPKSLGLGAYVPQTAVPGDEYFNDVSLLLHMDGDNGGTTFTDSSSNSRTITRNGTAQISTAQSKFGGASAYFNGTTDSLTLADISLGTDACTIELWFKSASTVQYAQLIGNESATTGFTLMVNHDTASGGDIALYVSGANKVLHATAADWSDDAWHHVALTRQGTLFTLWIDGVSRATGNASQSLSSTASMVIGRNNQYAPRNLVGYIDELRITKGVVRYSTGFTPATTAFPNSLPAASSVPIFTDVDTITTPPTSGQNLTWNGTKWVPGDGGVVGGAAGDVLYKDSSTDYDTSWQPLADKSREAVGTVNGQITGFVDRTSSSISFDEATRTLTIAPTGASFDVYYRGTKHSFSSPLTYVIPDTSQGRYYSISPTTWALYDAGVFGDIKNSINASYVMWDAVNDKALIVGDERHSVTGDPEWHYVHHRNVGTVWRSGGALSYTLNDAAAVTVAVGAPLSIADEDLEHSITHSATPTAPFQQILTGAASLPVMYLSGTTYVMTTAATVPWVAGTTTARYNPVSGGSGSLADAGEGKYISYWMVATNSQTNPVRLVMGRLAHDTVDTAYQETFEGYGVSVAEIVALYQIVLRTSTAYTANTPHVVIAAVRTIQDRVAASSSTFSATSHDSLTDRQDPDQHTIGAITGLQTALDAKQDDLVSGTNIKTVKSTSLLGSGDISINEPPAGGTTGQLLTKDTNTDYDYSWGSIKTVKSTSLLGAGDIAINEPPAGGTTGQVLTKDTNTDYDYSWQTPATGGGGGALTNAEGSLAADVQMPSSNTWYNGPSVSLDAGTWLVTAHITQQRNATTAETIYARISDGTNHWASQQAYHPSASGSGCNLSMTAVFTLAATTTVRAQVATSAGSTNSLIKAAMSANSAGANASQITAIKIG